MSQGLLTRQRGFRVQTATASERIWSVLDVPLQGFLGYWLILICAFLNLANVQVDKEVVAIDAQVIAKLFFIGLGGLYGAWGLFSDQRVRQLLFSFPVMWMVIIIGFFFAAVPTSITPLPSLVSAGAMAAILLLTVTALVQLGVMPVLKSLFYGMSLFIVFSWIVYIVWPEVGILKEPLPEGEFAYRMSGLAHANTLGQYAGLTVLLGVVLMFTYKQRGLLFPCIVLMAIAALVNSYSRTSLAATVLALLVGYRYMYFRPKYWPLYVGTMCLGLLAIMILSTQMDLGQAIEDKMSIVSKSGDAEELTSATGRSDIWAYAIRLIQLKPLTGYGAATSKYFLAEYSQYTHNLLLNIAFSTGVIGGMAGLFMMLGRLRALFTMQRRPLHDAIVVFIFINGLFENVICSILAGMPTMMWVLILCWPLLRDDPTVALLEQPDPHAADERRRFIRLGEIA